MNSCVHIKPEDFNAPALWRMVKDELPYADRPGYTCSFEELLTALEFAGLPEGLFDSAVELIEGSGLIVQDDDLNCYEVARPVLRPEDCLHIEES